jgi:hypothetical protein
MPARKDLVLYYRSSEEKNFHSLTMTGSHYTDESARKWAQNCFKPGVELYTSVNSDREKVVEKR